MATVPSAHEYAAVTIPAQASSLEGFERWTAGSGFPQEVRASYLGNVIHLNFAEAFGLEIPIEATTLRGFCRWAESDAFPERGSISYFGGELFVEKSPEETETHNKVKTEVARVISSIIDEDDLGTFFSDRVLLTNETADLATEPDAFAAFWQSFESGRVNLVPRIGHPNESMQVDGSPDWVLEIVSRSSIAKDTRVLRHLYHGAGIREFWLVDAIGKDVNFQVLVHSEAGYVAAPTSGDGWQVSTVFARDFRLSRNTNRIGRWRYRLEHRSTR